VFDRQGRVIAEEDPDDPGGVTKYGIDKSAHPNLTADQIRNMTEDKRWRFTSPANGPRHMPENCRFHSEKSHST
jgi:hypothetical protein